MLGLIKKDLFLIKSNLKVLVLLFVVYGFMSFQGEMNLAFVLSFMSVIIMISTFSYDTFNKWDAYVCSLPDGRKNCVRAKYLATIILISITTIIITILAITVSYAHTKTIEVENIFSTILGAIFATTLIQSFMYPAIYKLGVEKARIVIFVVVFGIATIGGILAKFIDLSSLIQPLKQAFRFLNNYWMVVIPIAMLLILYVSYKISESIYTKKEF